MHVTSDGLNVASSAASPCLSGSFAPNPFKCFDTAMDVHSSVQWSHNNTTFYLSAPVLFLFFYTPLRLSECIFYFHYNVLECRKAGNNGRKGQARRPIPLLALRRAFRLK